MKKEHTISPSNKDIDFLTQKINEETPNFGKAYPFAFFIRDKNDNIIAGCNGSVIFGAIHTDQLWVHPNHRKQGLGKRLMESVHNYGQEVECTMATVATMSFQGAVKFYKDLGYQVEYGRTGHTKGESFIFLKKEL